jgi:hypothetical protein
VIREEDYAFTVEACGTPWDVYRFVKDGKRGTLAYRKVNDRFQIGLFQVGELTQEEVILQLTKSQPS